MGDVHVGRDGRGLPDGLTGQAGTKAVDRLAAELRVIRDGTGKSLKQLQRTIHVSDSSLSRYLSGRTVPPWEVVEGLCRDAGRPAAAIHALYALWEQAYRERNGAERGLDADPSPHTLASAVSTDVGRRDALDDAAIGPAPQAPPQTPGASGSGRRAGPAWWRRHTAVSLATLLIGTAALFGSAGLWAGARLTHPAAIVVTKTAVAPQQQDTVCASWPWPVGQSGQAVGPAAQVHGAQHTASVELVTGTVDGRQMAWARIQAAGYGDRVWMDWSQNGGRTWVQCGPFLVAGAAYATRAHEIDPQWKFRACGDTPIAAQGSPRDNCTEFW